MKILSHRGWWENRAEHNTLAAIERSFRAGFGIETDVRDAGGQLVISHDLPDASAYAVSRLLKMHREFPQLTLALNVKSDGLQVKLRELLDEYGVQNYFVFDMSIPDTLGYRKQGFVYYTRQSEYEPEPALYAEAAGVWIDIFENEWPDRATLEGHLTRGKQICLVSPELHRREHLAYWNKIKTITDSLKPNPNAISLCTDFPADADAFFNS